MREERQNRLIKKRNIVLIGSMGTGKSHVGRMLARELGWQFIDTDRFLERERG
ncbi:MAG: (d)CMP kinase, partial [Negativicoccus succinicivorans]